MADNTAGNSIKTIKPANDPKSIHVGMVNTEKLRAFYQKLTAEGRMTSEEASQEFSKLFGMDISFTPGITSRVQTFEDAMAILPDDDIYKGDYKNAGDNISRSVSAFLKLRIICRALNESGEPPLNKSDVFKDKEKSDYKGPDWKKAGKWCAPWFRLYTSEEWELLGDKTKKEASAVFSDPYRGMFTGLSYCYTDEVEANLAGTDLCLKTKELSEYCGRAFADIWGEYLTGIECRRYKGARPVDSGSAEKTPEPETDENVQQA